jgi:hypothetical protein
MPWQSSPGRPTGESIRFHLLNGGVIVVQNGVCRVASRLFDCQMARHLDLIGNNNSLEIVLFPDDLSGSFFIVAANGAVLKLTAVKFSVDSMSMSLAKRSSAD